MKIKPPAAKDMPWFVISGATGFLLHMVFFNIGTGYVTAATSSVVIAMVPVITALVAYFIYKESLLCGMGEGIFKSGEGLSGKQLYVCYSHTHRDLGISHRR